MKVDYGVLQPGQSRNQGTYTTHPWSFTCPEDETKSYTVGDQAVFVPGSDDNMKVLSITESSGLGVEGDENCDCDQYNISDWTNDAMESAEFEDFWNAI